MYIRPLHLGLLISTAVKESVQLAGCWKSSAFAQVSQVLVCWNTITLEPQATHTFVKSSQQKATFSFYSKHSHILIHASCIFPGVILQENAPQHHPQHLHSTMPSFLCSNEIHSNPLVCDLWACSSTVLSWRAVQWKLCKAAHTHLYMSISLCPHFQPSIHTVATLYSQQHCHLCCHLDVWTPPISGPGG